MINKRLALGACNPPPKSPSWTPSPFPLPNLLLPVYQGASGRQLGQLVGWGVGVQNRGVAPPPPSAAKQNGCLRWGPGPADLHNRTHQGPG